jgi:hypothetical protein
MRTFAFIMAALAGLALLIDAKIALVDITWEDFRRGGTLLSFTITVLLALVLIGGPGAGIATLLNRGAYGWASLCSLAALAWYALLFTVLATAFTP